MCKSCRLSSLYSIDATWSRYSDHTCHLAAVDGNLLVGSMFVCVWAHSWRLFQLIVLSFANDVIYSFIIRDVNTGFFCKPFLVVEKVRFQAGFWFYWPL